jgi:hypothetical protein
MKNKLKKAALMALCLSLALTCALAQASAANIAKTAKNAPFASNGNETEETHGAKTMKSGPSNSGGFTGDPNDDAFSQPTVGANGTGSSCSSVSAKGSKSTGRITVTLNGCKAGYAYYEIYRSSSGSGWTKVGTVNRTGSSCVFTDRSAKINTAYQYRVRGCFSSGGGTTYSGYTKSGSVSISVARPPSTSGPNVSKGGSGSAKVAWGKVNSCSGYEIYCRTGTTGSYKRVADCSSSQSNKTISNLKSGQTYYFVIRTYVVIGSQKVYSGYSPAKSCRV